MYLPNVTRIEPTLSIFSNINLVGFVLLFEVAQGNIASTDQYFATWVRLVVNSISTLEQQVQLEFHPRIHHIYSQFEKATSLGNQCDGGSTTYSRTLNREGI